MTPSRQALEALLKEIGVQEWYQSYRGTWPGQPGGGMVSWNAGVLDRLMTWATPDRAEVRERIEKALAKTAPALFLRDPGGERNWDHINAVLDALTDAVCGEPKKEWCSHCQWTEEGWVFEIKAGTMSCSNLIGDAYLFCPTCATPRPYAGR